MAAVLLAEDERLGRQVAVKRLHAESPEDTAQRFRREARLGASLNHPNLVAVFDIVTDEEDVLIVMEYVDGETLRDALERSPLEPERAIEVLRGVAQGLDHAHSQGIIHRDVKPANVLLGRDGRVKLADLGIATAVEGSRITMAGTVLGTASYMAPEQLEGVDPGPAADIYSLAVVAWESLCGCRAYDGKTPLEIAHRKAVEPPPSLLDSKPDAPPAAAAVLERAMGADPSERPSTATAFVDELARALREPRTSATVALSNGHAAAAPAPAPVDDVDSTTAERAVAATPPPAAPPADYARHTSSRGRPSWLVPLAALLAVLAVGAAAVLALGGGGSDPSSEPQQNAEPAKKKQKQKQREEPSQAAAPAPASPAPADDAPAAEPEPTEPGQTDPDGAAAYELPQPSGSSTAEGGRLNDQGKSLIDAGRYDEAVPVLERAVRAFPAGTTDIRHAYALFNLGHALRLAGRPADAVVVLEERLKNPDQRATVERELESARAEAASG